MLKKLTRAEAHKAMDEGKVIYTEDKTISAWRDDSHDCAPYMFEQDGCIFGFTFQSWMANWYLEVEESWRPTEGEAVYGRSSKKNPWYRDIFSHTADNGHVCVGVIWEIIAPVKGNEGSAGTTRKLKNTLTAEDLR